MAFTTNVQVFKAPSTAHELSVSYRLLVAIELALKDASCGVTGSGHDVPAMLAVAANLPSATPLVSGQLNSYAFQLKRALVVICCQGKSGAPASVPAHNYPYLRYCRCEDDWGGVGETASANLTALAVVCQNLCAFLSVHGGTLGVFL
jgi:hypothetical protein